MFKSSIFWKIFLSFWLMLVLMIGGLITYDHLTENERHMRQHIKDELVAIGNAAVRLKQLGGVAGADDYLRAVRRTTGTQIYLFTPTGDAAWDAPPLVALAAARRVAAEGQPIHDFNKKGILLAASLEGGYIAVSFRNLGDLPAPPPFTPWKLLVLIGISGSICYLLSRYLSAPIIALQEVARTFATENSMPRLSPTILARKDELGSLARDFTTMVERIETLIMLQKKLIGDISHELRSPLTRTAVALELARTKPPSEQIQYLDRIEKEVNRLDEMLSHLLMLGRLEAGMDRFETVRTDLASFLHEVVADVTFIQRDDGKKVHVTEDEACTVNAVLPLLRSALENVLRNALHYTAAESTVDVTLSLLMEGGGAFALIVVRDHGPGVPEGELRNIFRPFYRVSDARDRESGGSGLGLHIAEKIVVLHGGAINGDNAADGSGFIVEIKLPLC